MNDMNELEKQLRAWTPRRPSRRLKERLFAIPASAERTPQVSRLTLPHQTLIHWLAPATAAALLLCVLFNQHFNPGFPTSASASPMVAAALSNQSIAAWLPGSFACDHNRFGGETFEWTNGSRSPSSIR